MVLLLRGMIVRLQLGGGGNVGLWNKSSMHILKKVKKDRYYCSVRSYYYGKVDSSTDVDVGMGMGMGTSADMDMDTTAAKSTGSVGRRWEWEWKWIWNWKYPSVLRSNHVHASSHSSPPYQYHQNQYQYQYQHRSIYISASPRSSSKPKSPSLSHNHRTRTFWTSPRLTTSPSPKPTQSQSQSHPRHAFTRLLTLLLWTPLLIFTTDHIFSLHLVTGRSMTPTLSPDYPTHHTRDLILVQKWNILHSDHLKQSSPQQPQQQTPHRSPLSTLSLSFLPSRSQNTPKKSPTLPRGSIIIFKSPLNPHTLLIKRIIGLPGDIIQPRFPSTIPPSSSLPFPQKNHQQPQPATGFPPTPIQIPPGHLWVEGDEAFHSRDSNYYGPIPRGLVVGKVTHILWPFGRAGRVGDNWDLEDENEKKIKNQKQNDDGDGGDDGIKRRLRRRRGGGGRRNAVLVKAEERGFEWV